MHNHKLIKAQKMRNSVLWKLMTRNVNLGMKGDRFRFQWVEHFSKLKSTKKWTVAMIK